MKFFTCLYFISFSFLISTSISSQTFQWTWVSGDNKVQQPGRYGVKGVPSIDNKPGSRNSAVSWRDTNGNLWLFGGLGFTTPVTSASGQLNDLWKYNPQTHEWTWVNGDSTARQHGVYGTKGVEAATNKPGARQSAVGWADNNGNLWLFGGSGYISSTVTGNLNDLWRYNIARNRWTWMGGDSAIYKFGIYGSRGIPSSNNHPGSRNDAAAWVDENGQFWMFGGWGLARPSGGQTIGGPEVGALNDLWKYNSTTNQWTWVNGDSTRFQVTVYGSKGVPSPGNKAGGRSSHVGWADGSGNLWLFGGRGYAKEYSRFGNLNDLWRFNLATSQWTWESGDSLINQPGTYGTLGVESNNNKPGARAEFVGWRDNTDKTFWIFGGSGNNGYLNDLWKYEVLTKQWTWVSGDNTVQRPGIYGVRGVHTPLNKPGARQGAAVTWTDKDGNLLLFGGFGLATNTINVSYLNDLWKFTLTQPDIETTAFGSGGTVTTDAGGLFDVIEVMRFQEDGKFVVAGTGGGVNFTVARYNNDGSIDNSFSGGKVVTTINGMESRAYDAVMQTDGKTVVAGVVLNGSGNNPDFTLARYNTNGTLDNTFGNNGIVITDFNGGDDQAQSIAVQNDGKILVAGWAYNGTSYEFAIARYLNNGSLDPAFDNDGKVVTPFTSGMNSKAYDLAVQPDGKIVVAGTTYNNNTGDFALARFNTNGTLDNTFNGTGKIITDIAGRNDKIESIVIREGGMIIAAGNEFNSDPAMPESNIALARYTTAGVLDINFDGDGKAITDLGGVTDKATDIALQADSKIVVTAIGSNNDFNVLRYNENGSSDNSFGTNGIASVDFNKRPDFAQTIQIRNNSIYVGGRTFSSTGDYFALAVIQNNSVAPISLISFTASKNSSNNVVLNWNLTGENIKHFEIESSLNGNNFKSIGSVQASGVSTGLREYSFTDNEVLQGVKYYRLKMIDAYGKHTYSNILTIKAGSTKPFEIFPNPVTNVLQVQVSIKGPIQVIITDLSGKLLKSLKVSSNGELQSIPIDVSGFSKGTYIIKVRGSETAFSNKFLKK